MPIDVFLWLLGALAVPLLLWGLQSNIRHREMSQKINTLLTMHEHPEKTGFGTVGLAGIVEENTRALKALTHYIRWLETKNGKGPPPPLEDR